MSTDSNSFKLNHRLKKGVIILPDCHLSIHYMNPEWVSDESEAVNHPKKRLLPRNHEHYFDDEEETEHSQVGSFGGDRGASRQKRQDDTDREMIGLCIKIVDFLQEIEGMEDKMQRGSLVSIGFNRREISPLQQQRSDIERVDLINIVKHVTALGKLGILIDNAIGFTQKREVMEALTELKTEYLILKGISKQTAVVPKESEV